MRSDSIPARCICGLSLLLVLIRVLRLSSFLKNQHSKFQIDLDRGPAWKPARADVASSINIVISLLLNHKSGKKS